MEDLETRYRLLDKAARDLDEHRRHLQNQEEERLQQTIKAYEIDLEAGQQDIKQKRLALETAIEREAALKRKHEAEITNLKHTISNLKRLKRSSTELPSERPQLLGPSAGTHDSGAQASAVASHFIADKSVAARAESTEQNDIIEPQAAYDGVQDGFFGSSHAELPDDDTGAADEELDGSGNLPSQKAQQHHGLPLTNKIISYKEVYAAARDPGAAHKHWIVEHPKRSGNFYILRCVDHNLNWGRKPVNAATQHLIGKAHGFQKRSNLAVEELGELVEDCDRQKASASNVEYLKFLSKDYKPKNTLGNSRRRQTEPAQTFPFIDETFEGVINPVVGEVYNVWWESHPSGVYLAVVLPHTGDGDWNAVGITGNLFNTGLFDQIPECFNVAKDSEEKRRLTWAEGYEDNGPRVSARKFPCLFLHQPLEIPAADQKFILGDKAEVLGFRSARQLCHRSTSIPPEYLITVDICQSLARDFETRLRTIQAKQKPAPEQETENADISQVSSLQGQQHPNAMTSANSMNSPQLSSVPGVPQHRITDDYPLMSEYGSRDNLVYNRLAAPSIGVGSLNYSGNSITSNRNSHSFAMRGYGSVQGMADLSTGSHAKSLDESGLFMGSDGNMEGFGSGLQPLDRPRQAASVPAPSNSQGLWPMKAAGPSALRPSGWRQNAMHSEERLEQDRMFRRGHSTDTAEKRDVMPEGAGKTA